MGGVTGRGIHGRSDGDMEFLGHWDILETWGVD